MGHGGLESEVVKDVREVFEAYELSALGEREIQGEDHGPDTEREQQHNVAAGKGVRHPRLDVAKALRCTRNLLPPLGRGGNRCCGFDVRDGTFLLYSTS